MTATRQWLCCTHAGRSIASRGQRGRTPKLCWMVAVAGSHRPACTRMAAGHGDHGPVVGTQMQLGVMHADAALGANSSARCAAACWHPHHRRPPAASGRSGPGCQGFFTSTSTMAAWVDAATSALLLAQGFGGMGRQRAGQLGRQRALDLRQHRCFEARETKNPDRGCAAAGAETQTPSGCFSSANRDRPGPPG